MCQFVVPVAHLRAGNEYECSVNAVISFEGLSVTLSSNKCHGTEPRAPP